MIESNGHIKDGKLFIHYRAIFDEQIKQLPNCNVSIKVEQKRKKRSLEQNRYYHGVVVKIVYFGLLEAGWQIENEKQAHEIIKELFFKKDVANKNTGEIMTIKTTTKETTFSFMEKLKEIQQWASEYLNVYIPDPNEQTELFK